jgi:hypothetical protein
MALRCRLSLSSQKIRIAKNMLTTTAAVPIAAFAPMLIPDDFAGDGALAGNPSGDVEELEEDEAIDRIVDAVSVFVDLVVTGA